MPLTDLPLDELRSHRPTVREPDDFDAFWADTIAQARAAAEQTGARPVTVPADTPVTGLVIEDLTFPGFAADPVRAWVTRPAGSQLRSRPDDARLPVVVEYLGYNGGRSRPGRTHRVGTGRLRARRDGHPRSGQRLGRWRHARTRTVPARTSAAG